MIQNHCGFTVALSETGEVIPQPEDIYAQSVQNPRPEKKTGWWDSSQTRKQALRLFMACTGVAMLPVAFQIYDTQSGGQGTEAIKEYAEDGIVSLYNNLPVEMPEEEKLRTLMEYINEATSIGSFFRMDSLRIAAINENITMAAQNTNNNPQAMKDAALEGQFSRIISYGSLYAFRNAVLNRTHPDINAMQRNRILAQALVNDIIEDSNNLVSLNGMWISPENLGSYLERHPEILDDLPDSFAEPLRNGFMQLFPSLIPPSEITGPVLIQGSNEGGALVKYTGFEGICDSEQLAFDTYISRRTSSFDIARTLQVLPHLEFQGWCNQAMEVSRNIEIGITFEGAALPEMPSVRMAYFDQNAYVNDLFGFEVVKPFEPLPEPVQRPTESATPSANVSQFRERAQGTVADARERVKDAAPSNWNYVTCAGSLWNGRADYARCVAGL